VEIARGGPANLFVDLRKHYPDLRLQVEFKAAPGFTILFGPSGAGKTTVLDLIAGLSIADAGSVALNGTLLFDSTRGVHLPAQERRIGYVFQDLALFPHLTAEQNIQYGLHAVSRDVRQERCNRILQSFHIAHLRARKPREISGGERQRVALARALVTDPPALLLDEPLAALDGATKSRIMDDLRAWNEAHQIPILYVTHSRDEVFALGERVLVLENGKIVAQGTPHEVMSAPRQESVAQLAGFENIFDGTVVTTNPARGTMTCRLSGTNVELETPLMRAAEGTNLRVGIRAGDILLAIVLPLGLSARNVIPGRVVSLEKRDVIVEVRIDCGVEVKVHLTLAARDSLQLHPESQVWLVIKTHSCHLMA